MPEFQTRFTRKLHFAFAAMLVVTLALSWYFYDSVKWFEHDVRRIAVANTILNQYRDAYQLGTQKMRLIEDSAAGGEITELARWHELDSELRTTMGRLREALAEEQSLSEEPGNDAGSTVLNELESLVASIFEAGESVRQALDARQADNAQAESLRLRASGTQKLFTQWMDSVIESRTRMVASAHAESISLAQYITGVLPLFVIALAGLTALITWLFSRSLTRSVSVLHGGAKAFTGGELNHRIPALQEREFDRLGLAFNQMAGQLAEHRAQLSDANVRLEAIVEERTRALKNSNEKLASVDESRRKLLADISHEFRTPLTVIRGEAEIALRGKDKVRAEYKETLERIIEQSDQATHLIDDLLFIARADAGEPRLKVRSLNIRELLGSVCDDFAAKAGQKSMSIHRVLPDEPCEVMADEARLRQVFAVLIENALRYSHEGSDIEVSLRRHGADIIVVVSDNGIGMTEDEAGQAFQRFFRGSRAQAHARGTGLGLPVALAIVEAHGGSIVLDSEPDEGTRVTVTLGAATEMVDA